MIISKQAENINKILIENDKQIYFLLSNIGKSFYFPSEGIISQTQEAKGKKIDATIGIALDDKKNTLILNSINKGLFFSKDSYKYAPTGGMKELRTIWKKSILQKNPSIIGEISFPIVCNGLTNGLNIVGNIFFDKDDEIISPNYFWGNYKLIFETTFGAKIKTFNLFKNNGLDLNSLEDILEKSTKEKIIILLNFPNNPSGYSPNKTEAIEIKKIIEKFATKGKKILIIIDDAYFGLFYEKNIFTESLFSIFNNCHKNILTVKIDGVSKEDYAWGLRVGFITYGGKINNKTLGVLEEKTLGIIRANISNTSKISQEIILNLYNSPNYEKDKQKNYNILFERYLEIKKILKEEKYRNYFESIPFNSGYFMSIKLLNKNAQEFRKLLLEKFDTGVISIGEDIIRIAFSSVSKKLLKSLFNNIFKACILLNKKN